MNAADIPEKLLAYLDGELPPLEAEAVREALARSPELERELSGIKLAAEFLTHALKPAKLTPSELARLPGLGFVAPSPTAATVQMGSQAASVAASTSPAPRASVTGAPILSGHRAASAQGRLRTPDSPAGSAQARKSDPAAPLDGVAKLLNAAPRPPRIPPRIWARIPHGIAASLAASVLLWAWTATSKVDTYVTVVARSGLVSDSPGSVQLVVKDGNHAPRAGQAIALKLMATGQEEVALGSWTSNSTGAIDANFRVPDLAPGRYALSVVADGWFDAELMTLPSIDVDRIAQVLVSPDKPLYQPGQTINLRILARRTPSNAPLARIPLEVTLTDPRDNKVFRVAVDTSDFGIASTSIPLADELTLGAYRIEVKRQGALKASGECVVTVKRYVLPPFRIDLQPAGQARYLLPIQRTRLSIDAQYLFGKPVAGGAVKLAGLVPAGANRLSNPREWLAQRTATLDAVGKAEIEITVPDVAWPAHVQRMQLPVEVSVTDLADHTETRILELVVARQPLLVEVVPVGGFRGHGGGRAQPVVVSTCTADGQPVAASVSLLSGTTEVKVETSALGLGRAEIDTGRKWGVVADHGRLQGRSEYDPNQFAARPLLLRSDKSYYSAGETMTLRLMGTGTAAYVDVVKDRQTYLTTSVALDADGQGELPIALASELAGLVSIHAYQVDARGVTSENSLEVFVAPASQLRVQADLSDAKTGDALDSYRPGTGVRYRFSLTDPAGAPVAGALSLAIIDKAVLALAESAPGLADAASQLARDLGPADDDRAIWERGRSINPIVLREPSLPEADRQAAMSFILARIARQLPAVLVNTNLDRQLMLLRTHQAKIAYWCGWLAILLPLGLVGWFIASVEFARQLALCGLAIVGGIVVILFGLQSLVGAKSPGSPFAADGVALRAAKSAAPQAAMDLESESIHVTVDAPVEAVPLERPGAQVPKDEAGKEASMGAGMDAAPRRAVEPEMRVRKRFVETLVWAPQIVTDATGHAEFSFELADNITSWRALIEAVDGKGRLGTHEGQLVTFQPFFARLDLPVHLTQNDRIELPIALHNYAKFAQTITLEIASAPWFEVEGGEAKGTLRLDPEGVGSHKATLVAKQFGKHVLRITARTADFADAIEREVEVVPDGERVEGGRSGRLRGGTVDVDIPPDLTPGTVRAWLRVHPGVASDIQSGLEAMLKIPNGCFEQSSSTNYPNVLISRYLKSVDRLSPAVDMKIRAVLARGFQKSLTFHDGEGGFGMYPGRKSQVHLSAYALMQLAQMAKLIDVEPELIARVTGRLKADLRALGNDPEKLAFACWAMLEAGVPRAQIAGPLDTLATLVEGGRLTTYGEALALQSFIDEVDGRIALPLLRNYARLAEKAGEGMVRWRSDGHTMMQGYGASVDVDTTALIARALARRGEHSPLVRDAVNWLIQARNPTGLWVTTQSTALVLLALTEGAGKANPFTSPLSVGVAINGQAAADGISIAPENADLVHEIEITSLLMPGTNTIALDLGRDDLPLTYTIAWRGYRGWPGERARGKALDLEVAFPDRAIAVGEAFGVRATYRSQLTTESGVLMLAIGVPPGCAVEEHLLRELVNERKVDRFEHRGRQVVLYLPSLAPRGAAVVEIGMRASRRLRGRTPESELYAYYSPDLRDRVAPVAIEVR